MIDGLNSWIGSPVGAGDGAVLGDRLEGELIERPRRRRTTSATAAAAAAGLTATVGRRLGLHGGHGAHGTGLHEVEALQGSALGSLDSPIERRNWGFSFDESRHES